MFEIGLIRWCSRAWGSMCRREAFAGCKVCMLTPSVMRSALAMVALPSSFLAPDFGALCKQRSIRAEGEVQVHMHAWKYPWRRRLHGVACTARRHIPWQRTTAGLT